MSNDKKQDQYPKLSEADKRWKQQEEFNSAGMQRELEDDDINSSIPESTKSNIPPKEDNKTDDNK